MPAVLDTERRVATPPRPTAPSRFGHLLAAEVDAILLWVSHQLLDWGWPAFLTDDFASVLGLVTAALVASIVVNLALVFHDRGRFEVATELVTTAFGLAVGLRLLEVFPFDFAGYANDWSGAVHGVLVLLIGVTGLAMVVTLVRLVVGPGDD